MIFEVKWIKVLYLFLYFSQFYFLLYPSSYIQIYTFHFIIFFSSFTVYLAPLIIYFYLLLVQFLFLVSFFVDLTCRGQFLPQTKDDFISM